MKIMILGGDGYLGWPTAMHFAAKGHDVMAIDNYLRRHIASETDSDPLFPTPDLQERANIYYKASQKRIEVRIGDLTDFDFVEDLFQGFKPDAIIHYAEQPSAPYSMRGFSEAQKTLQNNLNTTFNIIWGMINHAPESHMVKLGTMGEYGTPNIDIEEGWLEIEHKGRCDKFLFPRQAGSLYHTTKVLDTDLLWFYVRTYGIRVTDLMQGPVYGITTAETALDPNLRPNFHYDDIFGTVVNRFLVQAAAGIPLTVYGKGGQTRGYLNLIDTLQCVELAAINPPEAGKMNIYNQFVDQFTVNELAELTKGAAAALGIDVEIQSIPNPRKELEDHYYNPAHSELLSLGLKPTHLSEEILAAMLEDIVAHKENIVSKRIMPRVKWSR